MKIDDVKRVLNFDAGGLTGPAELTARSNENGWLIREAAKADPYFMAHPLPAQAAQILQSRSSQPGSQVSIINIPGIRGFTHLWIILII